MANSEKSKLKYAIELIYKIPTQTQTRNPTWPNTNFTEPRKIVQDFSPV